MVWKIVGAEKSVGCCRLVVTTFSVLLPLLPDTLATMLIGEESGCWKFICCLWSLGVVVTSFPSGGEIDMSSRNSWDSLGLGIPGRMRALVVSLWFGQSFLTPRISVSGKYRGLLPKRSEK